MSSLSFDEKELPIVYEIFSSWWTRVCLHTTAEGWKTLMISRIKEVVESMKKQAEIRVSGHLPSLDEYIHHRRLTSGIIPAATMIELGMDMELPDEVLSHPLMCIILDCTNDFTCLSNVRIPSLSNSLTSGVILITLTSGRILLRK